MYTVVEVFGEAEFGDGTGPIWLNEVACNGFEYELLDCDFDDLTVTNNCTHSEDAGVRCQGMIVLTAHLSSCMLYKHIIHVATVYCAHTCTNDYIKCHAIVYMSFLTSTLPFLLHPLHHLQVSKHQHNSGISLLNAK